MKIFHAYQFDEVYNLGAMSNVGISFKMPLYTQEANYLGFINLLEVIRETQSKEIKKYLCLESQFFSLS